jgi:hypothetical protein
MIQEKEDPPLEDWNKIHIDYLSCPEELLAAPLLADEDKIEVAARGQIGRIHSAFISSPSSPPYPLNRPLLSVTQNKMTLANVHPAEIIQV